LAGCRDSVGSNNLPYWRQNSLQPESCCPIHAVKQESDNGCFLVVTGSTPDYSLKVGLCLRMRSLRLDSSGGQRVSQHSDPSILLILSKAFLLADDKAIKDPVILRQLGE